MNGWKRFWGRRLGKQLIIVGLLAVSSLTGCATPQSKPQPLHGSGSGRRPGGRPGGRHQSPESLEGGGYRRFARSCRGWRGRSKSTGDRKRRATISRNQQGYYQPASQQGNYQPALLWASARITSRPYKNRIPVADRLQGLAPVSDLPGAFFMGKN